MFHPGLGLHIGASPLTNAHHSRASVVQVLCAYILDGLGVHRVDPDLHLRPGDATPVAQHVSAHQMSTISPSLTFTQTIAASAHFQNTSGERLSCTEILNFFTFDHTLHSLEVTTSPGGIQMNYSCTSKYETRLIFLQMGCMITCASEHCTYLPISSQTGVEPSRESSMLVLNRFLPLSTSKSVTPVHSLFLQHTSHTL